VSGENKLKALVVDDSAFMRKMISEILRNGGIDVIATATDGVDALEKTRRLNPDVITLDVEMPKMDGVTFLRELMKGKPVPVLVLSSLTSQGADATIQCLEAGAFDCMQKPSGSISLDIGKIGGDIVKKMKEAAIAGHHLSRRGQSFISSNSMTNFASNQPKQTSVMPQAVGGHAYGRDRIILRDCPAIVLIASSTGGPAALQHVVPFLPADLGAAVVLVQHLPVGFTEPLARRLDGASLIRVREAKEGDMLVPNVALVAPAGSHLFFDNRGRIALNQDPPLWGVRPAADVMFHSAAERFGPIIVGAVLTGMGKDGALGARAVRQQGGVCFAQDESSCVIYGMPRATWECGGADKLVHLDRIAEEITAAIQKVLRKDFIRAA
jgi:two-component system chemotaxis response regulator CheB